MAKTRTNDECAVCINAFDGINGRYCHKLHRYVEHAATPPCQPSQLSTNSNKSKSVSSEKEDTGC